MAALDFDLACAGRLVRLYNDREINRRKSFKALMKQAIKEGINEALGGTPAPPENDDDEGEIDDNNVL